MTARLSLVLVLALVLAACASVLGLKGTSPSHPFEHRAHVNSGVSCVACHSGIATSGDTDPLHFPTRADCVRCHAKPHDARECTTCHGESHVRGAAELARQHLRFEHRAHMARVKGDCVRCHTEIAVPQAVALRPTMATCFSCHEHQEQWKVRDCEGCHVDLTAENTLPASHLVHDSDFAREHGVRAAAARDLCSTCHTERSCAACHGVNVPALPSKLAFDDVRLSGLHRAGFTSRHAEEARAQPGLCSTCHSESSCLQCHAASHVTPGAAPRSPHPRSWLTPSRGGGDHGLQARIDPMSCAGCHGGAGEQLCIGCHKVGGAGGSPHGHGFTSTKNKMHDVPCRSCHAAGL